MTSASEIDDATWALITNLAERSTQDDRLANGGFRSRATSLGDSAPRSQQD